MRFHGLTIVALVVFSRTTNAQELPQTLEVGQHVIVDARDGERLEGAVEEASATKLTLRMGDRSQVLPVERIREIRVRRKDRLWNGLLIGTAAGALAGLVPDYYDDCEECHDALYGSIAVGAGAGLIVDALVRRTEVVYRAPSSEVKVSFGLQAKGGRTALVLFFRF